MDDETGASALAGVTRPRPPGVRLGVGIVVVVLLVVGAVVVVVTAFAPHGSSGDVAAVTVHSRTTIAPGSTDIPTAEPTATVVLVHVLGAVARPGLVQLGTGARVVDAIGAAGGLTSDADPAGVNLARPLTDGEQLVVPRIGEAAPPATGVGGSGASGSGAGASGAKVNLNSATETELETLPRIGPAMAARILAWRTENGRFASIQDLMEVTGIGDATFDGLKDLVTV